jgi:hypothetical protein
MSEEEIQIDFDKIEEYAHANRYDHSANGVEDYVRNALPPDYDHASLLYTSPLADASLDRITERVGSDHDTVTLDELQQIISSEIMDMEDQRKKLSPHLQKKHAITLNRLRKTEEDLLTILTTNDSVTAQTKFLLDRYISHNIDRNTARRKRSKDSTTQAKFKAFEDIFGEFYSKIKTFPIPDNPEFVKRNNGRIEPPSRENK